MSKTGTPLATGIAVAILGCGDATDSTEFDDARSVSGGGDVIPITVEDRSIAEKAVLALADHLDVPVSAVRVDSVRAVDWRDSSIGCPQPGEAYMQVITPGHKITLRVDGAVHVVHEANGNAFVCVRRKAAVSGLTNQLELVWAPQAAIARKDLAHKLGVDESQIMIAAARGTTWTDASLGCPEPGVEYPETRSEGFVLTLRHGGRNFTYHTDLDRVIACPEIAED